MSSPGFSICSVSANACGVYEHVYPRCVALTLICSIVPHGREVSLWKWKHHFLRLMIPPTPSLADSGLVFTGCFICLIYVPCPNCCMVPACSSHMAVQHALMRFPISRNTNCVFRPSLWLYDVWTHKSIPETTDLGRSKLDQARSPSVWVSFQSPDSFLSHISKMKLRLYRDWNFFYLLVIQPLYFLAVDFNAKH